MPSRDDGGAATMTKEDWDVYIETAKDVYEERQHAFLRHFGWTRTCSTPGAMWLWSKAIKGTTYAVSTDTAIYMENNL